MLHSISATLRKALQVFVSEVFVREHKNCASGALSSLMSLFENYGLKLEQKLSGKGNKTANHNSPERFYVRVNYQDIKTAIVLKPRFIGNGQKPRGIYGYHVSLDTDVISSEKEIETFLRVFDPDKLAKGEKIQDVIITAATRQFNEDIGNNYARKQASKLKNKAQDIEKYQGFIEMSDKAWNDAKPSVSQMSKSAVALIEEQRQLR